MEKRFTVDEDLRRQYAQCTQDLFSLDHMEITGNAQVLVSFYMPHHVVVNSTSFTIKLRVVFNAGYSLNEALMVRPVAR